MRSSVGCINIIYKREYSLVILIIVLEGYLNQYSVLASLCVKNLGIKRCPSPVYVLDKFLYSTLIMEAEMFFNFLLYIIRVSVFIASKVIQIDFKALCEEGRFP